MKRSINDLTGYVIQATDGTIGKVEEFFFDNATWTIRYLVVNTGNWLMDRKVLLSPVALGQPDWDTQIFPVNLTMNQVEKSPSIDTDMPVHRQREIELFNHYAWPIYWEDTFTLAGTFGTQAPLLLKDNPDSLQSDQEAEKVDDPHLHSTQRIKGYAIHALDGQIGHVEDFIVDDQKWDIAFLVVDTRNWLPGKHVLVSPKWISNISWEQSEVRIDLSVESIKNSPAFDASKALCKNCDGQLFDYYGRPSSLEMIEGKRPK